GTPARDTNRKQEVVLDIVVGPAIVGRMPHRGILSDGERAVALVELDRHDRNGTTVLVLDNDQRIRVTGGANAEARGKRVVAGQIVGERSVAARAIQLAVDDILAD